MESGAESCVCIWRLRNDVVDAKTSYLLIKILDDPFCPAHHPGETIDLRLGELGG